MAQTRVSIETEAGVIEAVLDDQKAPITVANLLKYVDTGQYDGAEFFRTVRTQAGQPPKVSVKIDVIQAQVNPAFSGKSFGPIPLERTRDTGLKHLDGSLSMPGTRRTPRRGFLDLHRGPAGDGLRGPEELRWSGLCCLRPRHVRDGNVSQDSRLAFSLPRPRTASARATSG